MRKKKIILILSAVALLSAVAVTGILLGKDRSVTEDTPVRIAEGEPERPAGNIPAPTDRKQSGTGNLDLDVRDLAPKPVTGYVVGEEIIYDGKENPT